MKDILVMHTGGTIGSASQKTQRAMNEATVKEAKRLLTVNFAQSGSRYARWADRLVDAGFPEEKTTLSESMSPEKLMEIAGFLAAKDLTPYAGIILLHGTDTLAFTASLFSFLFAALPIPMVLVSGNRPPDDAASNANANFKTAVELIWEGLAPQVYAVYRNADGVVRLFLGSTLMQCPNCSEDFRSASPKTVFAMENSGQKPLFTARDAAMFEKCCALSAARRPREIITVEKAAGMTTGQVLLLQPYTGLNYALYEAALAADPCCRGVVHGTYHSGTVALPGLVAQAKLRQLRKLPADAQRATRMAEWEEVSRQEMHAPCSVLRLAEACAAKAIPLYIAPSKLGREQYETMAVLTRECDAKLLNMTTEAAYAKLLTAVACGLAGDPLDAYMHTPVCNEMLD